MRDLKASMRFVVVLVAFPVCASLLEGCAGVLFAGVMIGLGVDDGDLSAVVVGAVFALLASVLVAGFAACALAWFGQRCPGLLVCVLGTAAPPLILVLVALWTLGGGPPWLVALLVPPIGPMIVLWCFRSVMDGRVRDAARPWLPAGSGR